MNYRHGYHAGNFADVLKHVALIAIISSLQKKDTPLCCLDTHAGSGIYDLLSAAPQRSKEYVDGIEKILQQPNPPKLVQRYLNIVSQINSRIAGPNASTLHYYPGSPLIARELLRPQDRLVACELQADEYGLLKNTFADDKQVAVHHTDGFLGLKAFLPPVEKRGLILIDPPYENRDEFKHISQSLILALKRFSNGVYAIWYPLKDKHQLASFYRSLKAQVTQQILTAELTIYPETPNHLYGSGLAIINPPWQLDMALKEVMPWLWKTLTINNQGGFNLNCPN